MKVAAVPVLFGVEDEVGGDDRAVGLAELGEEAVAAGLLEPDVKT